MKHLPIECVHCSGNDLSAFTGTGSILPTLKQKENLISICTTASKSVKNAANAATIVLPVLNQIGLAGWQFTGCHDLCVAGGVRSGGVVMTKQDGGGRN